MLYKKYSQQVHTHFFPARVPWCAMVCHGVLQFGAAWCVGAVWCCVVQCAVIVCDLAQFDAVLCGLCSLMQFDAKCCK
jgi:hypothetical protein